MDQQQAKRGGTCAKKYWGIAVSKGRKIQRTGVAKKGTLKSFT